MLIITTRAPEETIALGNSIGRNAVPGTVIALTGDLGSGKTAFTQGIAKGMGIENEYVTSPSYTLINHYPGDGLALFHVDLYRLSDSHETEELGLDEVLHKEGVAIIEWAEKFGRRFWEEDLEIGFKVTGEAEREISLTAHGPIGERMIAALLTDKNGFQKEGT